MVIFHSFFVGLPEGKHISTEADGAPAALPRLSPWLAGSLCPRTLSGWLQRKPQRPGFMVSQLGLSENRVNIPNEIAIFHRDNDQQNHWV